MIRVILRRLALAHHAVSSWVVGVGVEYLELTDFQGFTRGCGVVEGPLLADALPIDGPVGGGGDGVEALAFVADLASAGHWGVNGCVGVGRFPGGAGDGFGVVAEVPGDGCGAGGDGDGVAGVGGAGGDGAELVGGGVFGPEP